MSIIGSDIPSAERQGIAGASFVAGGACVGCGYDLAGLPMDGVCPECGLDVESALGHRSLHSMPREWLGRVGEGLRMYWFVGAVTVLGGIPALFVLPLAPAGAFVLLMCAVGSSGLSTYATWLMTSPPPAATLARDSERRRRRARVLLLIQCAVGLLVLGVLLLALGGGVARVGLAASLITVTLIPAELGCRAVKTWYLLGYLEELAGRSGDAALAESFDTGRLALPWVIVGTPLTAGTLLLAYFAYRLADFHRLARYIAASIHRRGGG